MHYEEHAPKCGWHCFEVAAYEYAQELALTEFEREGHLGPPGDLRWANEHAPSFFVSLDEGVLRSVALDRDYYALEEARYRFAVMFRSAWGVVSQMPGEEFG